MYQIIRKHPTRERFTINDPNFLVLRSLLTRQLQKTKEEKKAREPLETAYAGLIIANSLTYATSVIIGRWSGAFITFHCSTMLDLLSSGGLAAKGLGGGTRGFRNVAFCSARRFYGAHVAKVCKPEVGGNRDAPWNKGIVGRNELLNKTCLLFSCFSPFLLISSLFFFIFHSWKT